MSTSKGALLKGFALLPVELRLRIVELACLVDTAGAGLPRLHSPTALDVLMVSREFFNLASEVLYRDVVLTRPTQLRSFLLSMTNRPHLGAYVRSLYAGPDEAPPKCWLPIEWKPSANDAPGMQVLEGIFSFSTPMQAHIKSSLGVDELPRWCEPDKLWPIGSAEAGCRGGAVFRALQEAQRGLAVNAHRPCWGHQDQRITYPVWLQRCFQLQAALDLFLVKMRSLEDAAHPAPSCDSQDGSCQCYPALCLDSQSNPLTVGSSSGPKLVLTRQDLFDHLARRSSPTDRFNHPLLFARSGAVFDSTLPFPTAASFETITGALSHVLLHLPQLENLALAGGLQQAASGAGGRGPPFKALKRYSVGPPTLDSPAQAAAGSSMPALEALHICGGSLQASVEWIVKELPSLQHLRWTTRDDEFDEAQAQTVLGRLGEKVEQVRVVQVAEDSLFKEGRKWWDEGIGRSRRSRGSDGWQ